MVTMPSLPPRAPCSWRATSEQWPEDSIVLNVISYAGLGVSPWAGLRKWRRAPPIGYSHTIPPARYICRMCRMGMLAC